MRLRLYVDTVSFNLSRMNTPSDYYNITIHLSKLMGPASRAASFPFQCRTAHPELLRYTSPLDTALEATCRSWYHVGGS